MLAEAFRLDSLSIVVYGLILGAVLSCLFMAERRRDDGDSVRFFVRVAAIITVAGFAGFLYLANREAGVHRHRVQVAHDLRTEGFTVQSFDFTQNQVTVSFGQRNCSLTFDLADVYGHDPVGYVQRWRPTLTPSQDDGKVGLGVKDLQSLQYACTP